MLTKTKSLKIISKTTNTQHEYFIVTRSKILFRTNDIDIAADELHDILMGYLVDKRISIKVIDKYRHTTAIKQALTDFGFYTFVRWAIVKKVQKYIK